MRTTPNVSCSRISSDNFHIVFRTKGVSSAEKQELIEVIDWANEKLQAKSEKAKKEGTCNSFIV